MKDKFGNEIAVGALVKVDGSDIIRRVFGDVNDKGQVRAGKIDGLAFGRNNRYVDPAKCEVIKEGK